MNSTLFTPIPTKPGMGPATLTKSPGTAKPALAMKKTPVASIVGKKGVFASPPGPQSKPAGTKKTSKITKAPRNMRNGITKNIHSGVTPMPGGTSAQSAGGKLAAMLSSPSAPPLSSLMGKGGR